MFRIAAYSLVAATAIAFLVPNRYTSVARLMPPENGSSSGLAAIAATLGGSSSGGGISEMAGDLLGMKSTSDSFVGIMSSRTVQDHLIQQIQFTEGLWGSSYD